MSVYVAGFYGMANYGDDLFRQAIAENAQFLWPGQDIRFIAPAPGGKGQLASLYAESSWRGVLTRSGASLPGLIMGKRLAYCGGSLFQDVRGVRRLHRLAAGLGSIELEALGVSVGPFPDQRARQRVHRFVSTFKRVVVRDSKSHDVLRQMGLAGLMGGDLAALTVKPLQDRGVRRGSIVVAPCASLGAYTDEYVEGLIVALKGLRDSAPGTRDVVLLALNAHTTHGDAGVVADLARRLLEVGISASIETYADLGMTRTTRLLQDARLVIATRLHAAVVAYLSGIPVVVVAYHEKCNDFASDVGLHGGSVLTPSSDAFAWSRAIQTAASPPSRPPAEYRSRARSVYLGEGRTVVE